MIFRSSFVIIALSVVKKYAKMLFIDFSWAIEYRWGECAYSVSRDLGYGRWLEMTT